MTLSDNGDYFVLYCDFPRSEDGGYLDVDSGVEIPGVTTWSTGSRFEVPIETPIVVAGTYEGEYEADPKELFDGTMCLMSPRLVEALRSLGVDNIDTYSAVIRTDRGTEIPCEAVNIIGLVSAADVRASNFSSYDGTLAIDASVDGFSVAREKTRGLMLFRLYENVGTIVASRRVRDGLLAKGISTLRFVAPEQWIRI